MDVVIINWNTADQAIQAARGYAASNDVTARIFVFDNNSLAEELRVLEAASNSDFELIRSERNIGFGAAANLALRRGSGKYVLVSNADVIPQPDAVSELVRAADGNPRSGMIGPVFGDGGNAYHDQLPGPLTLLMRTLVGSYGRQTIEPPRQGELARVEQPSGACFLMDRSTWDESGGFDEGFFLWYEDVDLARRLHDRNRSGLVVGSARVQHIGGESFARLSGAEKQRIRLKSLRRYIALHHPRSYVFARPLLWLSSTLRVGRVRKGASS